MKRALSTHLLLLYAGCLLAQGPDALEPKSVPTKGFQPNLGQFHDQLGNDVPDVLYALAAAKGLNVQVLSDGLAYDTYRRAGSASTVHFHRLDIRFLGADGSAVYETGDVRPGRTNFLNTDCGSGSVLGVREYGQLMRRDLYPGIDLILSAEGSGGFKYDLLVHSGANLDLVRMEFTGHSAMSGTDDALRFALEDRTITEHIPASWRVADGEPVRTNYRVLERSEGRAVVGFQFPEVIDPLTGGAVLIDPAPVLAWASFMGDSLAEHITAIAKDTIGFLYAAGWTEGLSTVVTTGPHQVEYGGGDRDAFLAKYAGLGARIWCTYYGGTGRDEATGVSVDPQYQLTLVGHTDSPDGMATDSAFQRGPDLGGDAFVARFDSSGNRLWATYLGGSGADRATACITGREGLVYVTGTTRSGGLFDSTGVSPVRGYMNEDDGFVARFQADGRVDRCTFLGGEGLDRPVALYVDTSGVTTVAGATTSATAVTTDGAPQAMLAGGSDGFVMRFDTALAVIASTYLGGTMDDEVTGIEQIDSMLYVTGWSASDGWFSDSAAYQPERAGEEDAFVLGLGTDLGVERGTYYGGPGSDRATGISQSTDGALHIVGHTTSTSHIATIGATFTSNFGGTDAFVARFDVLDSLSWATYYGGSGADTAMAVTVYGYTAVHVVGFTESADNVVYEGAEMQHGGSTDGFIARFLTDRSTPCTGICNGSGGGSCQGGGNPGWTGAPAVPENVVCRGDSATFSVSGGALAYGHYWMWYTQECGDPQYFVGIGPEITIAPQTSLTLFVRAETALTASCGCTRLQVFVEDRPVATATATSPVCRGTEVQLSGAGGVTHLWEGEDAVIGNEGLVTIPSDSLTSPQTFVYTTFAPFGCSDSDTVSVVILDGPQVDWNITDVTCHGGADGTITLGAADGTISLEWNELGTDGTSVEALTAGTYGVTSTNDLGCTTVQELVVSEPMHPVDSVLTMDAHCGEANGSIVIQFSAEGGSYVVAWADSLLTGVEPQHVAAGYYAYTVSNAVGCTYPMTVLVADRGSISMQVDPTDALITEGDSVQIVAFAFPWDSTLTITWSPPDAISAADVWDPYASPQESTTYTAVAMNGLGCTASDSVLITVRPRPCPTFFMPDHFSPNGDGLNDTFAAMGGCMHDPQLIIVDREGVVVFEADQLDQAWDGTYKGGPQPTGSYRATFTAVQDDGSMIEWAGNINLLR